MKNIYKYIIITFAAILNLYSCNNEWDDELFENKIAFGKNGVADIYVRYKTDGKISYQIPVVVSGSKINNKEYNVHVALDTDTLEDLNFERFRYRDDLYFKLLDEKYYSLQSSQVIIPKGTNTATMDIDFTLEGIDMVDKYILPLTIKDDPTYQVNYRKHYRKALLNIIPFNDYSGIYSATDGLVYLRNIGENDQTPMTMDTRQGFVVDDNSIFFYAGVTEEEFENRELYKVIVTFEDGIEVAEGNLKLEAPNADKINFRIVNNASYTIRKDMDPIFPYLEHTYITLNMEYEYDEIVTETARLEYRFKGSLTLERKRNITIPDEDQQIIW
ncbi:MAG: DUF4973 domain-containing protein [Dysgonomonas sp.]|nr:DUF4973 domain-containing protein [Dysgonomonas sp.]